MLPQYKNNFTSAACSLGVFSRQILVWASRIRSAINFTNFYSLHCTNIRGKLFSLFWFFALSLDIRDCFHTADVIIPISFPLSISRLFRDRASQSISLIRGFCLTTLAIEAFIDIYFVFLSLSLFLFFQESFPLVLSKFRKIFTASSALSRWRGGKLHDRNISFHSAWMQKHLERL